MKTKVMARSPFEAKEIVRSKINFVSCEEENKHSDKESDEMLENLKSFLGL